MHLLFVITTERLPTSFMMRNKIVGFGDEGLLNLTGGPPS